MGELSKQVADMLDLKELVLAAFANACPKAPSDFWHAFIDDRREFFWRLTDEDKSLVYGETKSDVDELSDNSFVDTVRFVWRPEGEDFAVMIANTGLGDGDVIAIMALTMEHRR